MQKKTFIYDIIILSLFLGYFVVMQINIGFMIIKPIDIIILFNFIIVIFIRTVSKDWNIPIILLWFIPIFVIALISTLINGKNSYADILQLIELYIILPFVIYTALKFSTQKDEGKIAKYINLYIVLMVLESIIFFIPFLNLPATHHARNWGTMTTGNLPYALVIGLIAMFSKYQKATIKLKAILWIFMCFMIFTIIYEDSKASMLGLLLLLLIHFVFLRLDILKTIVGGVILGISIFFVLNSNISNKYLLNFKHIIKPTNTVEGFYRFAMNITGLKMIKENFILGIGPGNTSEVINEYIDKKYHFYSDTIKIDYGKTTPHNFWLEFIIETGGIAGIIFLIINIKVLRKAYRSFKREKNDITYFNFLSFVILSIMYLMVHSPGYHLKSESVFLYMYIFISIIVYDIKNKGQITCYNE